MATSAQPAPTLTDMLIAQLLPMLIKAIQDLLHKKATPGNPTPKPEQPDPAFPDDTIPPPPPATRAVGSVKVGLARVQLNRARFPEAYTQQNPFGLFRDLSGAKAGTAAIPWGSKIWIDLTPSDQQGKEILKDDALAMGLAYQTHHELGGASITGKGGAPGSPAPYETVDTDDVGNGISAWLSSNGFLHQFKAHNEGVFTVAGSVAGVSGEPFVIRVD